MTKEEIAQVLKKLRSDSGKTQQQVAEILGRKQQIIGHWETGYAQPDANTLFQLCEIYGVTVDEAFGFNKKSVRHKADARTRIISAINDKLSNLSKEELEALITVLESKG